MSQHSTKMEVDNDDATFKTLKYGDRWRLRHGVIPSAFEYEPKFEKYILTDADYKDYFERQFFHVYRSRMEHLLPEIEKAAKADIDPSIRIEGVSNVGNKTHAFIAGVLIKHMTNQPTVLKGFDEPVEDDEGNEDLTVLPTVDEDLESLATETDRLDLEDVQKQVVTLVGNIDHQLMTSGMVIGVYGLKHENSQFHVEKIVYPVLRPYLERPVLTDDLFIILTSGLSVTCDRLDVLSGLSKFASALNHSPFTNKVARIIFAGDLATTFCSCEKCSKVSINNVMPLGMTLDPVKKPQMLDVIQSVQKYFVKFDVDVMPGADDPCSLMLPQQPLPPAIIDQFVPPGDSIPDENSSGEDSDSDDDDEELEQYRNENIDIVRPMPVRRINSVPNPYCFNVEGFEIHGTSGQNVEGIQKRTRQGRSSVDVMKQILELGHLIPTAPDSTDCFPYSSTSKDFDPFVLDTLPHVFFAGNQRHFGTEIVDFGNDRKVCVVSVPKHIDSRTFVAVNLRTLKAFEIST